MRTEDLLFLKIKWKYLAKEAMMYGANEPAELDDPNLPRYIRITDLDKDGTLKKDTFKSLEWEKARPYLLQTGDILLARSGATVGKAYIHEEDLVACFAGYLIKFKVDINKVLPKFVYYYTQTKEYTDWISENTIQATIQNVSAEKYANLEMPLPSLPIQQLIISFLNRKVKHINGIVEQKEKLILLLEEKRQSILTEGVTKGLNPNVKMKDSGVEWIGEIPHNYKTIKLKHLVETKITDGPHETPVLYDEGVPFISAEAIKSGKVDFDYMRGFISKEDHEKYSQKCSPRYGDIFMVKSGATTGKIGIVDTNEEFSIWSPLALIRADKEKVLNEFLYYYMQSDIFQKQVQLGWNYGTQQNIGMGVIENLFIICPPLDIQKKLLEKFDAESKKIDKLKEELNNQIQKLQEYRQSLIYEAVTGKIDVHEFETAQ
ncbi:hypothetical protein CN497_08980 [Priestia megaterium]|uniref:Type I restriction modification DNA specificity domain-containing protein n=1 Tax=Priestia megaterium TaxID=1404 RepID=A0AAE5P7L0_PRIMG|nr:restriction endonuclease subunit S [Priestia megaterium]PES40837.1 hypothetical protein CN497_08980 [Priestia megaterium]